MKSLLENVNTIDDIIRQLQKMESKMVMGQVIGAYRECCKLIAFFVRAKQELIRAEEKEKKND
jgi:hypothetical protein